MGDIREKFAPDTHRTESSDEWRWINLGFGLNTILVNRGSVEFIAKVLDSGKVIPFTHDFPLSKSYDLKLIAPEIDFSKFDWDFFGQHGGLLMISDYGQKEKFQEKYRFKGWNLRESPFYYWAGGEQPVPDGVMVEAVFLLINSGERCAEIHAAKDLDWKGFNLISFRLTGESR